MLIAVIYQEKDHVEGKEIWFQNLLACCCCLVQPIPMEGAQGYFFAGVGVRHMDSEAI